MTVRKPRDQAKKAEHKVHLSDSMVQHIKSHGLNEMQVKIATRKFCITMHKRSISHVKQKEMLALAQSGLVDFAAKYGKSKETLMKFISADPYFCLDVILNDTVFKKVHGEELENFIVSRAKDKGWEDSLIFALSHEGTRAEFFTGTGVWEGTFLRTKFPRLLNHVFETCNDISQASLARLARFTDEECFKITLEQGWVPDTEALKSFQLQNKMLKLALCFEAGAPIDVIKASILDRKQRLQELSSQALPKGLANVLELMEQREAKWEAVKTALTNGDVLALDGEAILAAGNAGDEALRKFVNPKHWRTPAQREHLQALLENAPPQTTFRIQTLIAVLKDAANAQDRTGWGGRA